MATVSVPEKTLEHWTSQYINYRYRTHASLWWPALGEDIDIQRLPTRPGKVLQLELKTTTVRSRTTHDVMVDLGQLWEYAHLAPGHQPFYVFPHPSWDGDLTAAAHSSGTTVAQLGHARSGDLWFATWMVVLTTAQVAAVLRSELVGHGGRVRGTKACLVRYRRTGSRALRTVTWGSGAPAPATTGWRDFWQAIDQCGRPGWPQLVRVPAPTDPATKFTAADVRWMLTTSTVWEPDQDLITLAPDDHGLYRPAAAPETEPDDSPVDPSTEAVDHRVAVFVDAKVLQAD